MAARTNRLSAETSPYLRQHAHQPVDWYPWGPEALGRARDEDKPILLSVGYSACHWCHVMAHECFEREDLAAILNDRYISIKVDREERPDLDHLYQTVCQLLTHSGGWPLTVFLTPAQEPFFAGTYFPPDDRYGRPGFKEVLLALADAYDHARSQVADQARTIVAALAETLRPPGGTLSPDCLDEAQRTLDGSFDPVHGGFGGAPKFPNPGNLLLLLRHAARTGEQRPRDQALQTCRAMRAGGLFDQLAGGFHRYTVDAAWQVPHFEKMLYDNALLPPVYLAAWQATGEADLAATARETLDWALREMRHPDGGFYSTTDADSEGEEGRYFVWTPAELEAVLEPTLARLAGQRFGVTAVGNFEGGRTVLHLAQPLEALAAERGHPPQQVADLLDQARGELLAARAKRVPPHRDEKILAGWNGLMISALAQAGLVLGVPRYLAAAGAAAQFVLGRLATGDQLQRVWTDGQAKVGGYLDDYAGFANGLLDLFAATGEPVWYQRAAAFLETVLREFDDPVAGDLFMTAAEAEPLLLRPKDSHDSATPSGLALAAHGLLRLWQLTGEPRYRDRVERLLQAHAATLRGNAWGAAWLLGALDSLLAEPETVVIAGDGPAADALVQAATATLAPQRLVVRRQPATRDADLPALCHGRGLVEGQPAAWACRGSACQRPVTTPAELVALLAG